MKVRVTDDKDLATTVRQKLKENDGYCPCKLVKTPETRCMCKEFVEQDLGECHCGLYIKTEK